MTLEADIGFAGHAYRVPPPPPPPPSYRLFSVRQAMVAAFLITPLAGAGLVALNRWRLGNRRGALVVLAVGVALTAAIAVLAIAVKSSGFIAILAGLAIRPFAEADKPLLEAHAAAGGKSASWWTSLGVPVLLVAMGIAAWVAIDVRTGLKSGPHVAIGRGQDVYYGHGADEAEARAVGAFLANANALQDEADVFVDHDGSAIAVGFVIGDAARKNERLMASLRFLRTRAAAEVFPGQPVKFVIRDPELAVKETLDGPAMARLETFPEQAIVYESDVGLAEAERLRDALIAAGTFGDNGRTIDVGLRRERGVTVVSLVVDGANGTDPEVRRIVDEKRKALVEHGVGGGKVRIDLCDARFVPYLSFGPDAD